MPEAVSLSGDIRQVKRKAIGKAGITLLQERRQVAGVAVTANADSISSVMQPGISPHRPRAASPESFSAVLSQPCSAITGR